LRRSTFREPPATLLFDPARDAILVAAGEEGAYTVDVSLPSAPVLQWREPEREGLTVHNASQTSERVYLATSRPPGFTIVDAADLDHPRWSGTITETRNMPKDVVGERGDRYVYALKPGLPCAITVWDVGEWTSPTLVDSVALPSWAFFDLLIDGSILYAAGMGIQSFDISKPACPTPLTYLPFTGYLSEPSYARVEAGGRNFVVTMTDTVRVVEVSDPASPTLVFRDKIEGVSGWGGCAAMGSFVFALPLADSDELWSIDFSKPETPRVVHKMILEEGEGQYQQMTVDGDWLYTAPVLMGDPLPSLHVLRIDAGGALREVARHQLFAETWALAARERHILIGGEYGFGWLVDESRATTLLPGPK